MNVQQPILYIFVGYPGAGKTTIAHIIHEATGAIHLWADQERHKEFSDPTHSQAESITLYEKLNRRTEELLATGKSVVFDTNFNFYEDRQKLHEIADRQHAQMITIWVNTPKEIAKARAVDTVIIRNGYKLQMSAQQFEDIVCKLEPPTETEKVIKIDGSNIDEQEIVRLLGL